MNPTKTEAIARILKVKAPVDLAILYHPGMECQCNVAQDGGTRVDGEYKGKNWQAWTDGIQTWKSFRIPFNAATEPSFEDKPLAFDLEAHVEGIGMTGWDWQNKVSRWLAYDFDAISGHSEQHQKKLNTEELAKLQSLATEIPWVTVRKSTGGKGLHLYVFLSTPVPTANHTEHAALGRAILGKLSAVAGYDFDSKVDICGGNMWVWHRKLATNPDGLQLVKTGAYLDEPPINWMDHVDVVRGKRRKILARVVKADEEVSEEEKVFEDLSSQRPQVPLDDEHKRVLKYLLDDNQTGSWWDADHHMLVTHTWHIGKCHEELNCRGVFQTLAEGSEKFDHNCFAFPMRRGGWSVRRYGRGVGEAQSWRQDSSGYTHCYFNLDPDLDTVARTHGGIEKPTGGYQFGDLQTAMEAAKILGANVEIPAWAASRESTLRPHKDGRLIIEFDREDKDKPLGGWLSEKGRWKRIFDIKMPTPLETEVGNYDDLVRHLITVDGSDNGWVIKGEGNQWRTEPLTHVKSSLKSHGLNSKEVELLIGKSINQAWKIVNMPFREEYPGDRQWNRDSAQFRFLPNPNIDNLHYPTWLKVLDHCGKGLDSAIQASGWAKANAIVTGADYLKAWVASLFQEPLEPLPYLFFYGPQNSGKSTFHEALSLLITRGYQRADAALISQNGFNAELEGAVICVIEEINLSSRRGRASEALGRIKDWVTARQFSLHEKGETPRLITNSTHWIQAANDPDFCPVFPGDTRITMIYVDTLDPLDLIPKRQLILQLEKEAPDFLAAIKSLELPPVTTRMNLPVIATEEKEVAEKLNRTAAEVFFEEQCHAVSGKWIKLSELYDRFVESLDPGEVSYWSNRIFGKHLPKTFVKGRNPKDGQFYVGNISFEPFRPGDQVLPAYRVLKRGDLTYLVNNEDHQGAT